MDEPRDNIVQVPVKTLQSVRNECLPKKYKTESLLEWHYNKSIILFPDDLLSIQEINTSCGVLIRLLDDLLDQALRENKKDISMPVTELQTLSYLITVFSNVSASPLNSGSNLLEH